MTDDKTRTNYASLAAKLHAIPPSSRRLMSYSKLANSRKRVKTIGAVNWKMRKRIM